MARQPIARARNLLLVAERDGVGVCLSNDASSVTACATDGNDCTDDLCNGSGSCIHTANTAPCDDGLFCNGSDTCAGGGCQSHTGDPCVGGLECADACNEAGDDCNDVLDIQGSGGGFVGIVHSNSDIAVGGSGHDFDPTATGGASLPARLCQAVSLILMLPPLGSRPRVFLQRFYHRIDLP